MTPSPAALHNRLTALLGADNAWMDEPAIVAHAVALVVVGRQQ